MSHKVSSCEVIVEGGSAGAGRPDHAAASPASAGMLAAQIESADDALRALGVRGRDLYETLAPALLESTGLGIGFWRAGIASVAFDDAATDHLRDEIGRA